MICLQQYRPCGCRGNSVTPLSIQLCFRLWPLTGLVLAAIFSETKDGQHVSPLLPPERVGFVQRGELTEKRQNRFNVTQTVQSSLIGQLYS